MEAIGLSFDVLSSPAPDPRVCSTSSSSSSSDEDVNLASFFSFVLGMAAMGNVLLPLRESLYNSIWLGIVMALWPEVTL